MNVPDFGFTRNPNGLLHQPMRLYRRNKIEAPIRAEI